MKAWEERVDNCCKKKYSKQIKTSNGIVLQIEKSLKSIIWSDSSTISIFESDRIVYFAEKTVCDII